MADLKDSRWMVAKAALFVVLGTLTFVLLLLPQALWARLALQVLLVWSFARAYYFAFYVVEHYIDPAYRFAGLLDVARYLMARSRGDVRRWERSPGRSEPNRPGPAPHAEGHP